MVSPETPEQNQIARVALTKVLQAAHRQILIGMFTMTDKELLKILHSKLKAGVEVVFVCDATQWIRATRSCGIKPELLFALEQVVWLVDRKENHMHHKFAVVDGCTVVAGSVNWTVSGFRNNDEAMFICENATEFASMFSAVHARLKSIGKPAAFGHK